MATADWGLAVQSFQLDYVIALGTNALETVSEDFWLCT